LENEESDNGDDDIEDTMSIDNTTLLQTNVKSLLQQLPQRSEHRKILLHFLSQGFAIRDACKLFDVSESSLRRAKISQKLKSRVQDCSQGAINYKHHGN
jgi:DNA-directed RNA polymerase specialized sigma24 family protein